jgi:uncharacterized protein (TIGR03546 family)
MIGIKLAGKIIKALRSQASPSQIASGFILGMLLGLLSFKSLLSAVVILLIIILNVNIAVAVAGYGLFRLIAWGVDPWLHALGYWLLADLKSLQGLWTTLYNIPVFPLTRFNNTVLLGSLIVSIALAIPLYILVKRFVILYREKLAEKLNRWKIVQVIKGSRFFEWIGRISKIGA